MEHIFIDECGFARNWTTQLDEQPYYVLAAVCIRGSRLPDAYNDLQRRISDLGLPFSDAALGRGFEIPAKDVDRGRGYWDENPEDRCAVRDIMLGSLAPYAGTYLVMVVDKKNLWERYESSRDPYRLALQFLFERLQTLLEERETYGLCIYDENSPYEKLLNATARDLLVSGSQINYWSPVYGDFVSKTLCINRIIEFHMGRSENSIGLQVADFVARYTYSWRKAGKDPDYPGWKLIEQSLYRKDGKLKGFGYKEFPERDR